MLQSPSMALSVAASTLPKWSTGVDKSARESAITAFGERVRNSVGEDDMSGREPKAEKSEEIISGLNDLVRVLDSRRSVHPVTVLGTTLSIGTVFFAGIMYQQLSDLRAKVDRQTAVESVVTKVDTLTQQVQRMEDRLNRFIDADAIRRRPDTDQRN